MARVMIIGYGPLPDPGQAVVCSPTLRTAQMLEAARLGGHQISLYLLPPPGGEGLRGGAEDLLPEPLEGVDSWRFASHSGEYAVARLNEELDRVRPEAIVGVNTYPAYVAAMLGSPAPLWCDLNGHWMAEMQAKCHADGDDRALAGAWNIQRSILRRLDRFSAVSRPQLHAVIGELGSVGRLNHHTQEHSFGSRIPHALAAIQAAEPGPVLRGPVVPAGAFVILSAGIVGPRCDVETMISAISELMGKYPEAHFVATGGAPPGGDARAWQRLEALVELSAHRERFHLLGWVPYARLAAMAGEADLGINVDAQSYETMFAGRARLAWMASAGLAIASTLGTELSEWLEDGRALLAGEMRSPASFVEAIEPWIDQREKLRDYSRRARAIMESDFSVEATTRPLRKWLEAPQSAPDNFAKLQLAGAAFTSFQALTINSLEEQATGAERERDGGEPGGASALLGQWKKKLLGR